jgi:hypothetical protein
VSHPEIEDEAQSTRISRRAALLGATGGESLMLVNATTWIATLFLAFVGFITVARILRTRRNVPRASKCP